jgi:hypothetical protein
MLKYGDPFTFSNELTQDGDSHLLRSQGTKKGSPRSLQTLITFEPMFKEILKKIRFFERPDIIPYPFLNSNELNSQIYSNTKLTFHDTRNNPFGNQSSKLISYNSTDSAKFANENLYDYKDKHDKKLVDSKAELLMKLDLGSSGTLLSKSRNNTPGNLEKKESLVRSSKKLRSQSKSSKKSAKNLKTTKNLKKDITANYGNKKYFEGEDCDTCVRLHKHLWAKSTYH